MAESGSDHTTWMKDARFGMFIHWGLYSVPARQVGKGSLAEWIKSRERLNDDHYDAYFAHFVCGLVFTTRLSIGTTLSSPSMGSTPSATTRASNGLIPIATCPSTGTTFSLRSASS